DVNVASAAALPYREPVAVLIDGHRVSAHARHLIACSRLIDDELIADTRCRAEQRWCEREKAESENGAVHSRHRHAAFPFGPDDRRHMSAACATRREQTFRRSPSLM